jgi:hypothetical protein
MRRDALFDVCDAVLCKQERVLMLAELCLARTLAADIRLPWQQPCQPGRLTPGRVRRSYRSLRQILPVPASAPKPARPGPGRPPGSKNRRPATRYDVGKTVKRTETKTKNQQEDRLNNKLSTPGAGIRQNDSVISARRPAPPESARHRHLPASFQQEVRPPSLLAR